MKTFNVMARGFDGKVIEMRLALPDAVNVAKALRDSVVVVLVEENGQTVECHEVTDFLRANHMVPVCSITGHPYVCESCGNEQGHFDERCHCE